MIEIQNVTFNTDKNIINDKNIIVNNTKKIIKLKKIKIIKKNSPNEIKDIENELNKMNISSSVNNSLSVCIEKRNNDLDERVSDKELIKSDKNEVKMDTYYMKNREKKLQYQKEYNKKKADKIQDYNHEYYLKRKEDIMEKGKTKITCECGCQITKFNFKDHLKTKKHAKAMENKNVIKN